VSAPSRPPSFALKVPEGDNRPRRVCEGCGFIDYVNPKVVVGVVCEWEGRVLLCRRAIEPRRGHWTMPAGFLEEGESVEAGAQREAWEEARADVELTGLLGVYSIPRISQVHVTFRGRLRSPAVSAGEESLEVRLYGWDDIPWSDLAFPSVEWALHDFAAARGRDVFSASSNPPGSLG
jgi:ADP-ribose pyrophosphatase YjhB (NUDIX family)